VRPPFWNQIEHIQGDRTDADGVVKRLAGRSFDAVIDNQAHPREEVQSALKALRGNVGRYVVASTVSTYREGGHSLRRSIVDSPVADSDRFWTDYRGREPVREADSDVHDHPWENRDNLSKYGEGKRHVERVNLRSPTDWPYVIIRVPATLRLVALADPGWKANPAAGRRQARGLAGLLARSGYAHPRLHDESGYPAPDLQLSAA